jgi:hypothetical protein
MTIPFQGSVPEWAREKDCLAGGEAQLKPGAVYRCGGSIIPHPK